MQEQRTPWLAYTRVSTDEQATEGLGLEAQQRAINAEAGRRGWRHLRYIEDPGYSGRDTNRPGLVLAREVLRRGEAAGLVVAKMDRLSRSLLDFTTIMAEAKEQGWSLVALDCPVDLETPMGEAMVSVAAVFSQLERRMISQRTKDALAVKKAQGVRLGRPPTLPNDVRARIVRERQGGRLLREIADGLNQEAVPTAQGGKLWHPSTVRGIARREVA